MARTICLIVVLVLASCSTTRNISVEKYQPVSIQEFLDSPFGHDESIASFQKHFPKQVKIQKSIRKNTHYPEKVDTIYKFYHKSSEVFVYKTYFNREMVFGGVITTDKMPLINGIVPGISRDQFFKAFTNLKPEQKDSILLDNRKEMRKFIFIFSKSDKLKKISFSSYID